MGLVFSATTSMSACIMWTKQVQNILYSQEFKSFFFFGFAELILMSKRVCTFQSIWCVSRWLQLLSEFDEHVRTFKSYSFERCWIELFWQPRYITGFLSMKLKFYSEISCMPWHVLTTILSSGTIWNWFSSFIEGIEKRTWDGNFNVHLKRIWWFWRQVKRKIPRSVASRHCWVLLSV